MKIERNKKALISPLIVFIIFTAICLVCVFVKDMTGNHIVNWIIRVLFGIGALLFLFFDIYFILALIKNEPVIETTATGFYDRSGIGSLGFIAYKDIESYCVIEPFLVININDPDTYLKKANILKRFVAKNNKRNGFGYVSIVLSTFNAENFTAFTDILNNNIEVK